MTAGDVVNLINRRTRDLSDLATVRADKRTIVQNVQRTVNAIIATSRGSTTLNTTARRLCYQVSTNLPNAVDVINVRTAENKDLPFVDFIDLAHYDKRWFRQVGKVHKVFSKIGRDWIVLYPSLEINSSVTVIYTLLTAALPNDTVPIDLPDSDTFLMTDLSELLLYMKQRRYEFADPIFKTFSERMAQQLRSDEGAVFPEQPKEE